jgi:hypothetical protein
MKSLRGTARATIALGVAMGSLLLATGTSDATAARPHVTKMTYGIDTFFDYHGQSTATIQTEARNQFRAFKALGATSVGIAFPFYTSGLKANSVFATHQNGRNAIYQSPTPAILADVIKIAHADGLSVLLRPLLDEKVIEEANPKDYRGSIKPTKPTEWFQSYLSMLTPYVFMAAENNVEAFSVSGELNSMASMPEWPSTITSIGHAFHGTQVFTYSFNQPVGKVIHTGTSQGMDTYPLTDVSSTATVKTLVAMWNNFLKTKQYRTPGPTSEVTIDEIGIPAQDGAYRQPSAHSLPLKTYPFNQQIQVNWYTAACTWAKQNKFAGIYFWGSYLTENNGKLLTSPSSAVPQNMQPASQRVVKECFAGGF